LIQGAEKKLLEGVLVLAKDVKRKNKTKSKNKWLVESNNGRAFQNSNGGKLAKGQRPTLTYP
jgi:hypothetical protein